MKHILGNIIKNTDKKTGTTTITEVSACGFMKKKTKAVDCELCKSLPLRATVSNTEALHFFKCLVGSEDMSNRDCMDLVFTRLFDKDQERKKALKERDDLQVKLQELAKTTTYFSRLKKQCYNLIRFLRGEPKSPVID